MTLAVSTELLDELDSLILTKVLSTGYVQNPSGPSICSDMSSVLAITTTYTRIKVVFRLFSRLIPVATAALM